MTEKNDIEVKERTKTRLQPPSNYNVIFYNDDFTDMNFVVEVLRKIFHRDEQDAVAIMFDIHLNGRGIAGTYSHEVASEKRDETMSLARMNGFPLLVEIEKE